MYKRSSLTSRSFWHPQVLPEFSLQHPQSYTPGVPSSPPLWTRWFWAWFRSIIPLPFLHAQASVPLTSRWVCKWGAPKRESSGAQPGHRMQEKPVWPPGPSASLREGEPGHWQPPHAAPCLPCSGRFSPSARHAGRGRGAGRYRESQKEKGNLCGWRRPSSSYSEDGWVSNLSCLTHLTRVACKFSGILPAGSVNTALIQNELT